MLKKILIPISLLLAAISVCADEITIKASGEFAEELKALVQKYQSSEINGTIELVEQNGSKPVEKDDIVKRSPIEQAIQDDIEANSSTRDVYDKYFSEDKEKKGGVMDLLFGEGSIDGDASKGKALYSAKCVRCHGEKAEKSSYVNARNLITLPAKEVVEQLRNYKRDSGYGQSTGIVMRAEASTLTDNNIKDLAAYIDSLK